MKVSTWRILPIVLVLIAGVSVGQNAKVIHLDKTDALTVKASWMKLQLAQKEWDAVQKYTAVRYTQSIKADPDAVMVDGKPYKRDWAGGFEFSEDFTAIVPKQPAATVSGSNIWFRNCGGSVTLPNMTIN